MRTNKTVNITEAALSKDFYHPDNDKARRLRPSPDGSAINFVPTFELTFCFELFPRDPLGGDLILEVPSTDLAEDLCTDLNTFHEEVCSCLNAELNHRNENNISELPQWNDTKSLTLSDIKFAEKPTWHDTKKEVHWTISVTVRDTEGFILV